VSPDVGEWVVRIVIAVIVAAGTVFAYRTPRKASPYDQIVKRLVALEVQREGDVKKIEELRDEVRTLRSKLLDAEADRANAQTEITSLQRRVAGMYDDRDHLVRYIGVLRSWVAAGAKPPAPMVPKHLADVIPEWLPVDGAEPRPRPPAEPTD
jgi:hypothetical protein